MPRPPRNPNDLDSRPISKADDAFHPDPSLTALYRDLAAEAMSKRYQVSLGDFSAPVETVLLIRIPAGSAFRELWVDKRNAADVLEAIRSDWQFLDGYDGAWSASDGRIEVRLDEADPRHGILLYKLLSGRSPIRVANDAGVSLSVGLASTTARAILDNCPARYCITLEVRGLQLDSHTTAIEFLETAGLTFLFEIDRTQSNLLVLTRTTSPQWESPSDTKVEVGIRPRLEFPSATVEREPLEAFIRARALPDSLVLEKYLSFYHAIEHFFNRYEGLCNVSEHNAPGSPRSSINSPDRIARNRRSPSDRASLRRTIVQCIPLEELRDFILSTRIGRVGLADALIRQGELLRLPQIDPRKENLLDDVAVRITELRNGIAHSKEPRPGKLYLKRDLSYSALAADIILIQFVASTILSAPTSRQSALT